MSAPNLKEIEWAIQELERGESSFPVYSKLASLYTVRNEMMGLSAPQAQSVAQPDIAIPVSEIVGRYGDSDFLRAVEGKNLAEAWSIMDELMDALQVVNRRAYNSVMCKIEQLP